MLKWLSHFGKRLRQRIPKHDLQLQVAQRQHLNPVLNWVQVTGIGIGGIIGAGIFVLSGKAAAEYAGPSVIVSFIASGIVALLAALSFSELMGMMPLSGAAYSYTYAALGEYAAWFIGWNYALFYQLAALTVVSSWSKYVVHLIHIVSDHNTTTWLVRSPVAWDDDTESFYVTGGAINLPAIVISLAITALLIRGIKWTANVNLVLVVFKIIVMLIFIFATCRYVNPSNYTPFIPSNEGSFSAYGASGTVEACSYIFFAYVGFESIATVAEESLAKRRTLPYTTIAAVLVSFLLYIGVCTVLVGLVWYRVINIENPLFGALAVTPYGLWLPVLMDLGAIAALATVALTMLLSQTRILYAMAEDGLLPRWLSKVSHRYATPWVATLISGITCAVISGICPVDIVGETSSVSALVTYLFVHIEVTVMRYTHAELQRPFKVPFSRWLIPVVGSILCLLLMATVKATTGYRFLIWTAIGQIIYFSYSYRHSRIKHYQPTSPPPEPAMDLQPVVPAHVAHYVNNLNEPFVIHEPAQEPPPPYVVPDEEKDSQVGVNNAYNVDTVSQKSAEIIVNKAAPATLAISTRHSL